MTYAYRLSVSYGDRPTRIERLRAIETAHERVTERLADAEALWNASNQTMDARRDSCTSVAVILLLFAKRFGLSEFTTDRLNDLTTGLGELLAGRNSALLQRADVPTRTPAATDLVNQAIAQVCVDLFRGAGLSASDAWTRTARLFLAQGFRNFSVSKIKSLGRLSGAGASMEPAFEQYQMIKGLVEDMLDAKGAACPPSESVAGSVAKTLVARARHLDHRLVA